MAQKVLAGRASEPSRIGGAASSRETIEVKVDQVVLARAPGRAFADALAAGLRRTDAEVAVVYDTRCVTEADTPVDAARAVTQEMVAHGLLVARPGVGFPSSVHLERFASPARLCVTDEPRLASVGGLGMLTLVVPSGQLGQALARGTILVRPPRSVQVLLSGRVRPFVCARDIALELLRRGLGEIVRKVDAEHGAPVVIEFAGPSARLLSVGERAVLVGIAPYLGAAAAVFVSDERTEVYLRDQRRSKAHRALVPDAGAPCDDVLNLDLGAVDPLVMDDAGQVRSVRDLAGKPVAQVLLGGDSGTTLRDLFAAAALLKSKRVPPRLDLLLAVPSRQMLEVLAASGALTDLIATGARLIEPDARVMSGAMYPPPSVRDGGGVSLRATDPEPLLPGRQGCVIASAETLAYAVAAGEIGDPRLFKRPVRVTVPRVLPTDDVLVARERRADGVKKATSPAAPAPAANGQATSWKGAETLDLVDAATFFGGAKKPASPGTGAGLAVVCTTLDQVRYLAAHGPELASAVRAVVAPFIPSALVSLLSGAGIAALQVDAAGAKGLHDEKSLALPPPARWAGDRAATIIAVGKSKVALTWLASGIERGWAGAGTARPVPAASLGGAKEAVARRA
jgi:aconitate hydratase